MNTFRGEPFYHHFPSGEQVDSPYIHLFDEEPDWVEDECNMGLAIAPDRRFKNMKRWHK